MSALRPLGPILLALVLALGACNSAEEKAENHYQRAIALLDEGDQDRAMVELRNVFRFNGEHIQARQTYAELLKERGETREAFGQFQRLAEQDPQNAVVHTALTELALQMQDFETAGLHAKRAFALAPKDPMVRALKATIDFRTSEDRPAAVAMARGVLEDDPSNVPAHMIVIAEALAANNPREALRRVDSALAEIPDDEGLHLARLTTLEALGDIDAAGQELQDMAQRFPENEGVRDALIQWYLRGDDPDGAEAVLRETAALDPQNPAPKLTVVQFLYKFHGQNAARAELEKLVRKESAPAPFQRALAELDFSEGRTEEAIAALQSLLEQAPASNDTRDLQATLAGMLAETGKTNEAAALIETVLAGDPTHAGALKLRARLAIEEDRPDAAIQDMRTALGQAPRDPEIMTIMAQAHERAGARELMGERLALAVEVSNRAPAESLRYASYLMQDDKLGSAEGVIVDALRSNPDNRDLLNMLGRIHLTRRDWSRASQVADILRDQGDSSAIAMANALEAESLRGQGKVQEAVDLLAELADKDGDATAMAELVQTQLSVGNQDAARSYLQEILAREPDNRPARLLLAGVEATSGNAAAAEQIYRGLISEAPQVSQTYQALFALLMSQGQDMEAEAVLDAGITAASDKAQLLFTKAGLLGAKGDVPGAIALYEELYDRDSSAQVVANNLASLLTDPRANPDGDPELTARNLERAWTVARRLRSARLPQFQDTYGWIQHLRGASLQALDHLVPASEALPDNAIIQFHRGEAEFTLERWDAARKSYMRALGDAEAGSPLPETDRIQERLKSIELKSLDPGAAHEG